MAKSPELLIGSNKRQYQKQASVLMIDTLILCQSLLNLLAGPTGRKWLVVVLK